MSSETREMLDELYPGRWAQRLVPLCSRDDAHQHGGQTCKSPGKVPVERGWPFQADRLYRSDSERDSHLTRIADHVDRGGNVGLALPRSVVALDADTEEAAAWLDTALPDAPYQQTQRGAHFLVSIPDGAVLKNRTKVEIAESIEADIRGHGSQIVVEPSIHAAGTSYCWKRPLPPRVEELSEVPGLILSALEKSKGQGARSGPGESGDEIIREGERNERLASIAGGLRRHGDSREMIEKKLLEMNDRQCRPPLAEGEVRGIAESISRYEPERRVTSGEMRTDMGNARRLVRRYGRDLRYCVETHTWHVWDGRRWAADKTGRVMRCAKKTVRGIFEEAEASEDDGESKAFAKHAVRSQSQRALRAMVESAESELEVVLKLEAFDAAPQLLNVENGTLDLDRFELFPHRREDLLTKLAPVEYHAEARSGVWERFLEQTLPDASVRRFAQKVAGYTLAGRADRDRLFLVHGPSRTGKGCFQDALSGVLGRDYVVTMGLDDLAHRRFHAPGPRPELVRLRGARLVIVYETSGDLRLSASLVKSLAGSDTITARGLHQNPIEFQPEFTLIIASNHRPRVPDDDEAIWERLFEIPFLHVVPEEERDKTLRRKLRENPAIQAAILAWAVEGLRALDAKGFDAPRAVQVATRRYREDMDPIAEFVGECCELAPDGEVLASELRRRYEDWCEENGPKPISARAMGPRLRNRGCAPEHRWIEGKKQRLWRGIRLAESGG